MSGLYRVSGVVEAPDGTTYRPLFYGDHERAYAVFEAVCVGARERGEAFDVRIVPCDGSSGGSSWSGPARRLDRAAFEVVDFGFIDDADIDPVKVEELLKRLEAREEVLR